jgi:hypothetical protein
VLPTVSAALGDGEPKRFEAVVCDLVAGMHPALQWSIERGERAVYALVVTGQEDERLRPFTDAWKAAAPPEDMMWEYHDSVPAVPDPTKVTVNLGRRRIRLADVRVAAQVDEAEGVVDIAVHHPDLPRLEESQRRALTFLPLDAALGERLAAERLRRVETAEREPRDAISLLELRDLVRELAGLEPDRATAREHGLGQEPAAEHDLGPHEDPAAEHDGGWGTDPAAEDDGGWGTDPAAEGDRDRRDVPASEPGWHQEPAAEHDRGWHAQPAGDLERHWRAEPAAEPEQGWHQEPAEDPDRGWHGGPAAGHERGRHDEPVVEHGGGRHDEPGGGWRAEPAAEPGRRWPEEPVAGYQRGGPEEPVAEPGGGWREPAAGQDRGRHDEVAAERGPAPRRTFGKHSLGYRPEGGGTGFVFRRDLGEHGLGYGPDSGARGSG